MPASDPIADMLTRIRNANAASLDEAIVPASRIKVGLAKILREEGFIKHYKVARQHPKGSKRGGRRNRDRGNPLEKRSDIRIFLKYGANGENVIHGLKRMSRPGLRRYVGAGEIPRIEGGFGITVLSTSRGLLTGAQCRKRNIGGELLCAIW
ncbi:MAG TPA: 30S ribosomal protein S8 [Sumerlaeia bacterium]|nr:30S ribosomal protein S8 [Sumerlaeia bacterium]